MTLFLSTISFLAEDAAAAAPPGANMFPIMMIGLFAMMYFMVIRPQKRQRKEHEERMASLKTNDKIITTGGIYGTITNVKQASIILRVADGVRIEVDKSCVATILTKADEPAEAAVVPDTASS
jgi:preprotein translocase subunit YajC